MLKSKWLGYFFLIFLSLGVFNWYSLYGLELFVSDDQARYSFFISNFKGWVRLLKLDSTGLFLRSPLYFLMSFDPFWSRLVVLLTWMIPSCFLFFILCTKHLNIHPALSLGASILPGVLPNLPFFPTFLDGSYMAHGLLFLLISILAGFEFIDREKRKWYYFAVAVFSYFLALQITELAIFLIVPMLFLFFALKGNGKKVLQFGGFLVFLAVLYLGLRYFFPRPNSEIIFHNAEEIISRLKKFLLIIGVDVPGRRRWEYPYDYIFLVGILGFLLIWNLVRSLMRTNGPWLKETFPKMVPIFFGLLWTVTSSFTFIFFSKYLLDRYFYLSAFGFYLFILAFLSFLFREIFSVKREPAYFYYFLVLTFILLFGTARIRKQVSLFGPLNQQAAFYRDELSEKSLPPRSQIVILEKVAACAGGHYIWSSGYFQFLLKRPDVNGLLSLEPVFHFPFDTIRGRNYSLPMSGLSKNRPVFLFRDEGTNLKQFVHALSWHTMESGDSDFELIRFDSITGLPITTFSGKGYRSYLNLLDSLRILGISREEILFGGELKRKDSLRLGVN